MQFLRYSSAAADIRLSQQINSNRCFYCNEISNSCSCLLGNIECQLKKRRFIQQSILQHW